MNVLMISDVYFPRINGVSTSIRTFAKEFRKRGHRVVLAVPDYGARGESDDDIVRIPSRRVVIDPEDRMMRCRNLAGLHERLGPTRPDIVHIHTPFLAHYAGVRLSKKLGVPCVVTYHTFFEEYLHHYVPFVPRSAVRFLARTISRLQCNQVGGVIVRSGIEVTPTGIDIEQFEGGNGNRFRAGRGIDEERPVLVYMGRLAFEKNIGFLLDVLDRVRESFPDVLMVLAGEGPAARSLAEEAARRSLKRNVLFVGNLYQRQELLDCYSAGDVFVFASRTDTQSLVLLEAMALGVAVVSTAVLGTKDILGAERGALVADDELEDFVSKVELLLRDKNLRARIGGEGKAYVRGWTSSIMAERMLKFYETVIAKEAS
jgi:glycosyltransferase involved in cell wall biosynthesis